jgi:hypothetical protein
MPVVVEVCSTEIGVLIARGLIAEAQRDDKAAVAAALYELFDAAFGAIERGDLQFGKPAVANGALRYDSKEAGHARSVARARL